MFIHMVWWSAAAIAAECTGPWLELRKEILRIVDHQAFDIAPYAHLMERSLDECPLGHVSFHLILDVRGGDCREEIRVIHAVGWARALRSGWPVFSILRGRLAPREVCPGPLTEFLTSVIARRQSAEFLLANVWHLALTETCSAAIASAFLATAWSRFPVVDGETDALVAQAERVVARDESALNGILLAILDDINRMFTAFFIDSGALYGEIDESVRHYDGTTSGPKRGGRCVVRGAETVRGCHPFARISADMDFWLDKKVTFQDQLRAFVPITDQKLLVVRIINNEVQIILPRTSHLRVEFADAEPQCLISALIDLLGKTSFSRPIELVLNHGDLPILRKRRGALPQYNFDDVEARMRSPLFSLCVSDDFWDLLFPNVCRPRLHALPHSTPWEEKKKQAFWRGTDRGAINWAHSVEEMNEGSTRARFLRTLEPALADTAFIADDLMNCTVVSSDPNLVPLAGQDAWRFLLDIPGNGYSGSLKQKLTSSSAVLLLTDSGRGSPVFEHYHLGLQEYVHVVPLGMENGNDKIRWALDNDEAMRAMARNANTFMDNYERTTQCYLWRLLSSFSEALAYDVTDEHDFPDSSVFLRQKVLHRPTPREASEFNRECLELIRSY